MTEETAERQTPLAKAIDQFFERDGPEAILKALALRCKDESAIAAGESDESRAMNWRHVANVIDHATDSVTALLG